jgi:hypothetical protein
VLQALTPASMLGGKAPIRLAAQKIACAISAYAQNACLLSLQMGSMNKTKRQRHPNALFGDFTSHLSSNLHNFNAINFPMLLEKNYLLCRGNINAN